MLLRETTSKSVDREHQWPMTTALSLFEWHQGFAGEEGVGEWEESHTKKFIKILYVRIKRGLLPFTIKEKTMQ